MKTFIDFLLDNRWLVAGMLLAVVVAGIAVMLRLPIEAFPDLTNNQVVVTVHCPGLSPVEVEQLVTYPIAAISLSKSSHRKTAEVLKPWSNSDTGRRPSFRA